MKGEHSANPYAQQELLVNKFIALALFVIGCVHTNEPVENNNGVDTDAVPVDTASEIVTVVDEEIDADLDGFTADQDCDDTDPSVHPDAEEVCDEIDNDCDAEIDENLTVLIWHEDLDGDGYGRYKPVESCKDDLEDHVLEGGDCDDTDPAINPDGVDLPFDGLDQDCDGTLTCEYPIRQINGRYVTAPNEMRLVIDPNTPSGAQTTGPNSHLIGFRAEAVHPECPPIVWDTSNFEIDFKVGQWSPTNIELYDLTYDSTTPIAGPVDAGGPWPNIVGMTINSPEIDVHDFALYANTAGAEDDTVTVSIDGNSVNWSSMGVQVMGGVNDISGQPIDFF